MKISGPAFVSKAGLKLKSVHLSLQGLKSAHSPYPFPVWAARAIFGLPGSRPLSPSHSPLGVTTFVYSDLAIFSGRAHPELAQAMCARLGRSLGKVDVFEFSNENIFVQYQENIRQRDVYLVQPFSSPVNTSIMELLVMLDAARRASAGRLTAVIPYFAYGRSDKKDQPRVPITARLIANLLETAGAERILTMNLHAGQIQGFFNVPVDELNALYPVSAHFHGERLDNYTVVATDVGDEKRARDMAARLGTPLAIIEKRRIGNSGRTEAMNVIGEVEGRNVLLLDDEIDTAGTMVEAVRVLRATGCGEVIIAGYHAVLSGPAIQRLTEANVREIVVTDSVPVPEAKRLPNMTIIPVAAQFGDAIGRIHSGQSVGALFV
jgi:ribose-phosphate pyrophosphokinase